MKTSKDVRARLQKMVTKPTGGNSNRTLRELAIDVINESGKSYSEIAHESWLCKATVVRLAEGYTIYPRADTIDRILKTFGVTLTGNVVTVKNQYLNQKKTR